ncbi:MAG: hypothetical protein DRN81_02235 [Thermoproteota archaeon]|nr:MAG: hypothetical protein DRN81_02235 [Candidatus Korarchaeota archaeon]
MVRCEVCNAELVADDLSMGVCPECSVPISSTNREALLKASNLDESVPESRIQQRSESKSAVEPCNTCGNPIPVDDFHSGTPCPACGNDPRTAETPQDSPPSKTPSVAVVSPVEEESPKARSVKLSIVTGSGLGRFLDVPENTPLGRDDFLKAIGNEVSGVEYISSEHLKFLRKDEFLYVVDLGSRNGTSVNHDECTANVPKQLNVGDRLVISGGGSVFRVEDFEGAKSKPRFRILDEKTGVSYVIRESHPRILVGRQPDGGPTHPLIEDIYSHRIAIGESKESVSKELLVISRKQFELRHEMRTTGQNGPMKELFVITNFSGNGTVVNGSNLQGEGEAVEIGTSSLPIIIDIQETFRWRIEEI